MNANKLTGYIIIKIISEICLLLCFDGGGIRGARESDVQCL